MKDWLKAKIFLIMVLIIWAKEFIVDIHLILLTPLCLVIKNRSYRRWVMHMWLAQDQKVNATLGGNCDVTVSSMVGYLSNRDGQHKNVRPSMTARGMEKVIDLLFKLAINQNNHCIESYERSEKHFNVFFDNTINK